MSPPVSLITSRVRALDLGDSIGKAAAAMRTAGTGAAAVCINGRVLGLLTGADLAAALDGRGEEMRHMPVATLAPRPVAGIPDHWSASQALSFLRREDLPAAPVVDTTGHYVGMVGMADAATAVCGRLRPRTIGGMATPLGVYLTDGNVRGGVGDGALVGAGIFMAVLQLLATSLTYLIAGEDGWLSSFAPTEGWIRVLGPERVQTALLLVIFAVCFRLCWVSGLHAAEHQVVHAIESGDDLRTDVVRGKPRVHPRCGTNLVVGLLLSLMLWNAPVLREWNQVGGLLAVIVFLFSWRRLGSLAQQYITTRPATDAQIRNGIRAGEQLLAHYQDSGAARPRIWLRFWNMGIGQVFFGWGLVAFVLYFFSHFVEIPVQLW